MRHIRSLGWSLLLVVAVVRVAPAQLEADRVSKAIDNAVAYIKSQQQANGSWTDFPNNPTGVTSLCTLALLSAGESPDSPTIRKALDHLRKNGPPEPNERNPALANLTYALSLQAMVFAAADPVGEKARIQKLARWIEKAQITTGKENGSWGYGMGSSTGDNSNAQFALLGLHEAERAGVRVNEQVWRRAQSYWQRTQDRSGAWSYKHPEIFQLPKTGSMTAAGIASMVIASGRLSDPDAKVVGEQVICCGREPTAERDPVERGLEWLARRFTVNRNPNDRSPFNNGDDKNSYQLYYLYGVERIGRLTGQRWIGRHDWYREGSELLVGKGEGIGRQLSDGAYKGGGHGEEDLNVATSLALLFLSKGRRPVLIAKLQHNAAGDWNRHRHDLEHLTRHVEARWKKQTQRELTWQTIASEHVTLDDLRQTPVLFISGRDSFAPSDTLKEVLRAYVNQGGFILAENCCEKGKFDAEFRQAMTEIFPQGQLLPIDDPSHPIYGADELLNPKFIAKHPLYGINTGCRVSVVYTPKNLGCYWELAHLRRDEVYPRPVLDEIDFCLGLGSNILAYATNRQLKFKHEIPNAEPQKTKSDVARGTIFVAKLKHNGGCDEAPVALANALRAASAQLKLPFNTDQRLIAVNDPRLFDYHLVYMHGLREFAFSDDERKTLRTYLQRGGTLAADAINSNEKFAESFRREMALILPGKKLVPLAPTDSLIKPTADRSLGTFDLSQVTLRVPVVATAADRRTVREEKIAANLETIDLDKRHAVIFSPYDLSCGLENFESLQFQGYTREDAKKILLNMLLYSLQR